MPHTDWQVPYAAGLASAGVPVDDAARQLVDAGVARTLPPDAERLVADMGLQPTVRDRALLLIERSRILSEEAERQSGRSDRLRATAAERRDDRQAPRDTLADARDETLERREAIADHRDATLTGREATADARDGVLDEREARADARATHLDHREAVVDAREADLWQHTLSDLRLRGPLLDAVDGAVRRTFDDADA